MWTAIFLAQDEVSANEVKNKFISNNILIKIKPIFNEESNKHDIALMCFIKYYSSAMVYLDSQPISSITSI